VTRRLMVIAVYCSPVFNCAWVYARRSWRTRFTVAIELVEMRSKEACLQLHEARKMDQVSQIPSFLESPGVYSLQALRANDRSIAVSIYKCKCFSRCQTSSLDPPNRHVIINPSKNYGEKP
jgi:hypothetical protein